MDAIEQKILAQSLPRRAALPALLEKVSRGFPPKMVLMARLANTSRFTMYWRITSTPCIHNRDKASVAANRPRQQEVSGNPQTGFVSARSSTFPNAGAGTASVGPTSPSAFLVKMMLPIPAKAPSVRLAALICCSSVWNP